MTLIARMVMLSKNKKDQRRCKNSLTRTGTTRDVTCDVTYRLRHSIQSVRLKVRSNQNILVMSVKS